MAESHDHRGVTNQHGYQPQSPYRQIKRNFKTWCKGKDGVYHRPELKYPPNLPGYVQRRHGGICQDLADIDMPGDWLCWHAIICTECDKVLAKHVKDLCPVRIEQQGTSPGDD